MNPEAARATVEEHHKKWGSPGEPINDDLSRENLMRNGAMCPFGYTPLSAIVEAIAAATGDLTALLQQDVKKMTGEPLKRVCFREVK